MADYVESRQEVWEPLRERHPNVWLGTSVETQAVIGRALLVAELSSIVRFLSCEPLLGPLDLTGVLDRDDGINWVIVGGESGRGARPMSEEWVLAIQAQCRRYSVPFFFKQWGGFNKKRNARLLQARTWDGMPARLPEGPTPV